MKRVILGITFLFAVFLLNSCSPRIKTSISASYPVTDYREKIEVYLIGEDLPEEYEVLGQIKIGDTGFSTNCRYEVVIDKAQIEARKVGGNALQIVDQRLPSVFGSSCHRITARILKVQKLCIESKDNVALKEKNETEKKYALLNVYRLGGAGSNHNFNLFLGDSLIWNIRHKQKGELKIRVEGKQKLWISSYPNEAVYLDFVFGETYFLRCSVNKYEKQFIPEINGVNSLVGYYDLSNNRFKTPNNNESKDDVLILEDGRHIACKIISKDEENVYFTLEKDGIQIDSQYSLSKIQSIQYANNN